LKIPSTKNKSVRSSADFLQCWIDTLGNLTTAFNIDTVTLVAPSKDVFEQVLEQEELTKVHHQRMPSDDKSTLDDLACSNTDHVSLITFPTGASEIQVLLWTFLLPLRYAMHYTVPDVNPERGSKPTVGLAYLATFMCLLWLVAGSYAMVSSLENLADLLDVPDAVVGVTVSAAGM
jgi:Ca2+/Na+ antiporter